MRLLEGARPDRWSRYRTAGTRRWLHSDQDWSERLSAEELSPSPIWAQRALPQQRRHAARSAAAATLALERALGPPPPAPPVTSRARSSRFRYTHRWRQRVSGPAPAPGGPRGGQVGLAPG